MPTPDEYLQTVPSGILRDFRDKVFLQDFIKENSSLFLMLNWAILLISKLKSFIKEKGSASDPFIITSSPPLSPLVQPRHADPDAQRCIVVHATQLDLPIAIKQETDTDIRISRDTFNIRRNSSLVVKQEDMSINILVAHQTSTGVCTCVTVENSCENIEILDSDNDVAKDEFVDDDVSDGGDASMLVASDWDMEMEDLTFDAESLYSDNNIEDLALDSDELLHNGACVPSRTVWMDPGLTSEVCNQTTFITHEVTVDRTKYLKSQNLKFDFHDTKGNLLAADALIKRKDQDSSKGPTGHGDSTPKLTIFTSQPIGCYFSCLHCSGFTCCEAIDLSLVPTEHFKLDPASLETLIAAQIKSCITEASSVNHFTLMILNEVMRQWSKMAHIDCPTSRIIFVPVDPALRMAHGVVGATVKSVENVPTMKILMNGKTPSIFNPALHSTHKKQTMIHKDKLQQFPSGLGLSSMPST
ncbi:hypothetical protein BDN71DRAFT_1432607 [Pleurotus eryngii]|uniref:Uncharacterized protein n=1 Tax=Pleurotus eryngii TaxID=5323 RepID=A0A9P6DEI1_PLEER|nr:hypothetical protein BDN71DRAFT_1432607 [Pleurotus eryngii]